jgi:hypothetical protein
MLFGFRARVDVDYEHTDKDQYSKVLATTFNIEPSPNLDRDEYMENDLPTQEGCYALTETLCLGLIANIHLAHQKGYRDSAEHLRAIIQKLEDGFIEQTDIERGNFRL